jgi:hypothetical protein
MRVLHLILLILVLALVGLSVMAYFDAAPIPALNEMAWSVKGYGPARSAEDAVARFNKALGKRDYVAASRYLTGDEYQRQLRKVAKVGAKLSESVANFRHTASTRGIESDKIERLLLLVDPFPKSMTVEKAYPSEGGDFVAMDVREEYESKRDPNTRRIQVKKVDERWLLDFKIDQESVVVFSMDKSDNVAPVLVTRRQHLDNIEKYGQNLANAVNLIKSGIKTDASVKNNVYDDLKKELQDAMVKD